jgi:hypothetical protein
LRGKTNHRITFDKPLLRLRISFYICPAAGQI